jgi:hypothetical protein
MTDNGTKINGTARTPAGERTDSMTSRTHGWEAQTVAVTASAPYPPRQSIDEYRRKKADRAIAHIEDRYRRGLSIPDVR